MPEFKQKAALPGRERKEKKTVRQSRTEEFLSNQLELQLLGGQIRQDTKKTKHANMKETSEKKEYHKNSATVGKPLRKEIKEVYLGSTAVKATARFGTVPKKETQASDDSDYGQMVQLTVRNNIKNSTLALESKEIGTPYSDNLMKDAAGEEKNKKDFQGAGEVYQLVDRKLNQNREHIIRKDIRQINSELLKTENGDKKDSLNQEKSRFHHLKDENNSTERKKEQLERATENALVRIMNHEKGQTGSDTDDFIELLRKRKREELEEERKEEQKQL